MSTQVPIGFPSIPLPNATPESLQQSVLAIKQNIEIGQGTRGTAFAAKLHPPTAIDIALAATLRKVS